MLPLDHVIAFILFVIGPVLSRTIGFRRLRRASPGALPRTRISVYRVAMIVQWTLMLSVLAVWWAAGRSLAFLGLEPRVTYGLAGTLLGVAIVLVILVRQRGRVLNDDASLAEVRDRLHHLELMLPHSRGEFVGFAQLSITAGICEELLYRGYLIWYLAQSLPLVPAMVVASVAFGLGHMYQGVKGIALTTLVGAFLAAVYWLSGSLYVSMLIHALMDLHSGHLAWRAYERSGGGETAPGEEGVEPTPEESAWVNEGGPVVTPTSESEATSPAERPVRQPAAGPDSHGSA